MGVFDNNDDYILIIKDGYCGYDREGCANGIDIENEIY